MTPITDINELRRIQIGILDSIVAYCEENSITYFLACGSLIGAIRHKGYIPWDDDIDLFMPRDDYKRLVEGYNDPSARYEMWAPERGTDNYLYSFAKVVDTRTVMVESEAAEFKMAVYVDLFPLDYAPDSKKGQKRLWWWKKKIYRIRRAKMQKSCFLDSKFNYLCYRYFPLPLSVVNWIVKKFIQGRKPTNTVCNMTEANVLSKECFPVEWTKGETVPVEFEGKLYTTMNRYHDYLTNFYGNYMELPPEDKRVAHKFKAWWKD